MVISPYQEMICTYFYCIAKREIFRHHCVVKIKKERYTMQSQAKDLFQLQSELVDRKVEMVANQAIDRVVDQIISLKLELNSQFNQFKLEMHSQFNEFKQEMHSQFNEFKQEIRSEFDQFKQEIRSELGQFKQEMRSEFDQFKQEMRSEFDQFKQEMRSEFNQFKQEMNLRCAHSENRIVVVETKLGIIHDKKREVRGHFIDYSFKAGWMFLGIAISAFVMHFHFLF